MKYLFTVLVLVISISSFAQKTHPEKAAVEETAHAFLKYLVSEHYEEAKAISTKETITMIEQIEMFSAMVPDSLQSEMDSMRNEARKAKISFTDFQFDEDHNNHRCTVTFTVSTAPGTNETMLLEKNNGKWLVNMMDLVSEETEAVDAAEEAAEEAVRAVEEAAEKVADEIEE